MAKCEHCGGSRWVPWGGDNPVRLQMATPCPACRGTSEVDAPAPDALAAKLLLLATQVGDPGDVDALRQAAALLTAQQARIESLEVVAAAVIPSHKCMISAMINMGANGAGPRLFRESVERLESALAALEATDA